MADIISDLPRNLMDCILERMPLRDAAKTSILSRKWRYIWATHPQVMLDKQFFKGTIKNKPFIHYEFVSTITNILLLHTGPILKFNFYIPNIRFDRIPVIDQWILVLSRNGVKELTIENSNLNPYKLPSYMFACSELTHLKLCNCIFNPPRAFGGFRSVVSLYVMKITFPDPIFGALVLTFPLPESLTFATCTGIGHLHVHAPKLKFFALYDSHELKWLPFKSKPNLMAVFIALGKNAERQGKTIEFIQFLGDLPRIVHLILDGFFLKMRRRLSAFIWLNYSRTCSLRLISLLFASKFLASGIVRKKLPTKLNHLKQLKLSNLGVHDVDQILCTLCLLRSSPNLQDLELWAFTIMNSAVAPAFNYLDDPDWMDLTLERLQTLQIKLYQGLIPELFLIKVLLSHPIA